MYIKNNMVIAISKVVHIQTEKISADIPRFIRPNHICLQCSYMFHLDTNLPHLLLQDELYHLATLCLATPILNNQ